MSDISMNSNYPMGVTGASDYFNQPDAPEEDEFELSPVEKLAIAQAFQKAVGELTKTGVSTNLRGIVDAEMEDRFEQARKIGLAPKSFDVELLGQKVGTYSITTAKDEPSKTVSRLVATDAAAYRKWAVENGFYKIDEEAVTQHFIESGEVPDGCVVEETVIPEVVGGGITRTTLRIDQAKVANVLDDHQLMEASYMLLGGEF